MIDRDTVLRNPGLIRAGLRCRYSRLGPELDLVTEYLADNLPSPGAGERREVLLEPRIISSFPDAVVLYWDETAGARLRTRFDGVRLADLRMLSALALRGCMAVSELAAEYGEGMTSGLRRLEGAGAVGVEGDRVSAARVADIFAVRRLVAIEAKMGDWRKGLEQAVHNTWFASESYLLMPTLPRSRAPHEEAGRLSVGLIDRGTQLADHPSAASSSALDHPSVGAWLVNAWAAALS